MEMTPTYFIDRTDAELGPATAAIGAAGNIVITESVSAIKDLVAEVNRESRRALAEAADLHTLDQRNPAWKAQQLATLPARLAAATTERLEAADKALKAVEDAHLDAVVNPDLPEGAGIRDELRRVEANTAVREELRNHVEGIKPGTAAVALPALARNPRFAALMAGSLGDSLIARFALTDASLIRNVALKTLREHGTPAQKRHLAALDAVGKAAAVIALAREGARTAAEASQRPPVRPPSAALMS